MVNHRCLSKRGYVIDKEKLTKEEERQLVRDLTVKTVVLPAYRDFQKPKKYKIFLYSDSAYYVPRFYGIEQFGSPLTISLPAGQQLPSHVQCHFQPLSHQKVAIDKLLNIFDPAKKIGDGGVLSLPCGYGKTYCAIYTACQLRLKTLIVVPTECLMDQWAEAIKQFTNGTVGFLQRDRIEIDNNFVVAMLNSVCLKDYPPDTFTGFGLLVIDECHHISSEMFCKALLKIRTRFTLGLSATPERKDGLSHVAYKFIGPLFHKEKRTGANRIIVKKILLGTKHEAYEVLRMSNKAATINTAGITTALSNFEERNQLIIFCLRQLIAQDRKILLLSSRREHLHYLKLLLDKEGLKKSSNGQYATYGFYYGKKGTNRVTHKKILDETAKCDIILGIDVIAKEGLDIPDLNTLIFATPGGTDVEQPVGRILRRYHKDKNPMVIDFVDKTGNYQKHWKEREKWYKSEDYLITELGLKLNDDDGGVCKWQNVVTDYLQRIKLDPQRKSAVSDLCLLPAEPKKTITIKKKPADEPPDICYL